jgi:hypothetical protein
MNENIIIADEATGDHVQNAEDVWVESTCRRVASFEQAHWAGDNKASIECILITAMPIIFYHLYRQRES